MLIASINGNPGVTLAREHQSGGAAPSFVLTWRHIDDINKASSLPSDINEVGVYQSFLPFIEVERSNLVNLLRAPL
jgi:hypothetical protein